MPFLISKLRPKIKIVAVILMSSLAKYPFLWNYVKTMNYLIIWKVAKVIHDKYKMSTRVYDTFITVSDSSLTDQMQLKAFSFFDWIKCQCLCDDQANLIRKRNVNNINNIPIYPTKK